jgi:hypothetical protein
MKKYKYYLISFLDAAGVFVYVAAIAWIGFHSQNIFGNAPSFLIPLFMLLLFVVSACVTGALVLGRPILMYLNGQKKESFILFFSTLGWLVLFLAVVVITLILK